MSTDAVIHLKFVDGCGYDKGFYDFTPPSCEIKPLHSSEYAGKQGATHYVDNNWRYYDKNKGGHIFDFPQILACLIVLLADPCVEKVWYNGDSTDVLEPIDKERLFGIAEYFLEHSGGVKVY